MATLLKLLDNGQCELKDGGARVDAISWDKDGNFEEIKGHEPIVGCSLLVGSITARSFSEQDYWLTTPIIEIVEKTDEYWIFKTNNSTYKLLI
ncbi:MAG TPA: hypothetical protein PLD95_02165 [bacterium]|jgi:hypothetical protein|nr:MAG: hypothetical protein BWX59_01913 [Bacteroidetes bacterium ADurb.Bin028]HOG38254.1 hypothetical protein [bacterium]